MLTATRAPCAAGSEGKPKIRIGVNGASTRASAALAPQRPHNVPGHA